MKQRSKSDLVLLLHKHGGEAQNHYRWLQALTEFDGTGFWFCAKLQPHRASCLCLCLWVLQPLRHHHDKQEWHSPRQGELMSLASMLFWRRERALKYLNKPRPPCCRFSDRGESVSSQSGGIDMTHTPIGWDRLGHLQGCGGQATRSVSASFKTSRGLDRLAASNHVEHHARWCSKVGGMLRATSHAGVQYRSFHCRRHAPSRLSRAPRIAEVALSIAHSSTASPCRAQRAHIQALPELSGSENTKLATAPIERSAEQAASKRVC